MMFSPSFVSLLVLSFSLSTSNAAVIRDSSSTVPLAKRLNLSALKNLVSNDLSRAKHFRTRGQASSLTGSLGLRENYDEVVTNTGVPYTATIGVGNPPTE
ncbi:hypothetical protein C0991_011069, partial [Blastosporella zonata]